MENKDKGRGITNDISASQSTLRLSDKRHNLNAQDLFRNNPVVEGFIK